MGFNEHAGNSDCHRRTRKYWYKLSLSTRFVTAPTRLLHRMGGVEYHRRVCCAF